jgi:hypothetical protein
LKVTPQFQEFNKVVKHGKHSFMRVLIEIVEESGG